MTDIQVNGKTIEFLTPATLSALIEKLNLINSRIAIELNGKIVPRSLHANTLIQNHDILEIIVAVGGG